MKADNELMNRLRQLSQTIYFEHPSEAQIEIETLLSELEISNNEDLNELNKDDLNE